MIIADASKHTHTLRAQPLSHCRVSPDTAGGTAELPARDRQCEGEMNSYLRKSHMHIRLALSHGAAREIFRSVMNYSNESNIYD